MTAPWQSAPPAGSEFSLRSHLSHLGLFVVGGYHSAVPTRQYGDKPAVRCSVVMLDGADAGNEFVDVMIFNSHIVKRLRGAAGTVVLGRVVLEPGAGANDRFDLADPEPRDEELASGWHRYYPNRLAELSAQIVATYHEEETRLKTPPPPPNGYSQAQTRPYQPQTQTYTNPPPPPPAPPMPTPPSPWGQTATPAPPVPQPQPSWASLLGGAAHPGDGSQPVY